MMPGSPHGVVSRSEGKLRDMMDSKKLTPGEKDAIEYGLNAIDAAKRVAALMCAEESPEARAAFLIIAKALNESYGMGE
jgi:hypothetical protein